MKPTVSLKEMKSQAGKNIAESPEQVRQQLQDYAKEIADLKLENSLLRNRQVDADTMACQRANEMVQLEKKIVAVQLNMSQAAKNGDMAAVDDYRRQWEMLMTGAEHDERYIELLKPISADDFKAKMSTRRDGIPSGFWFGRNGQCEELEIATGALTFIAAQTSHGKSRLLQNMALNMLTKGKKVLYISLEEDFAAVCERLLNIYADQRIGDNNAKAIRRAYTQDMPPVCDNADIFAAQKAKLEKYMTDGGLRVLSFTEWDTIRNSTDIVGIISAAHDAEFDIVFVDYMQLIHSTGFSRKDELANVCKDLMSIAVKTGLPIVLAAQLNRQAGSPLSMEVQNVAEAADIENAANTIILLWDSAQTPMNGDTSWRYRPDKLDSRTVLTDEAERLHNNWHNFEGIQYQFDAGRDIGARDAQGKEIARGEYGALYLKLAKCRGMQRNMEAVLLYRGRTFKVYTNETDKDALMRMNGDTMPTLDEAEQIQMNNFGKL